MADHSQQLRELAAEHLVSGEEIIATANVNYAGKVNLDQPPTGLAALQAGQESVMAGEELAERLGDRPDVTFPSARQMALVLTGGRLLIWSRGGFKSKPKALIGEVPLESIERVDFEEARMLDRVQVKLRSGWEVNLEAPKNEHVAAFATELRALVDSA